jgi:lysophospholipase L1-like esterase
MRKSLRRLAGTTLTAAAMLVLLLPGTPLGATGLQAAPAGLIRPGAGPDARPDARLDAGSDAGPVRGPFVALGDSYAAGSLIPSSPSGRPAGCLRSSHDYGADAAAALRVSRYVDATCSGASTASMTAPEKVAGGTHAPQFSFLAAGDSVVTLTIGGDDIGYLGIMETCAKLSLTDLFGDPCERHYRAGGTDRLVAAINAAAPKVAAVLRGIHARAPHARVLLVGYPDILPTTGDGCWPEVPLAFGDVPYLRGIEVDLNQMLARAAAAHGATFVDTYHATIGHDACQRPGVKDVEGLIPTSLAEPFHPNKRGEQVMANRVLAALRA